MINGKLLIQQLKRFLKIIYSSKVINNRQNYVELSVEKIF